MEEAAQLSLAKRLAHSSDKAIRDEAFKTLALWLEGKPLSPTVSGFCESRKMTLSTCLLRLRHAWLQGTSPQMKMST